MKTPARTFLFLASLSLAPLFGGQSTPIPAAGLPPAHPSTPPTIRHLVVVQHRICGESVTTPGPDGTQAIECAWLNNGRGPKVHARLRQAEDGTLVELTATGTDTFGVALDERFSVEQNRARWQSHAERGEQRLTAPAFYLPISPLPTVTGLLARAALRAGGRLALLPLGELRVTREETTTIRGRHLTCYALDGLDFLPVRVWLDDNLDFFGLIDPSWMSHVPPGWGDAIDPLGKIELELRARRAETEVRRLAHRPPAAGLAFVHGRVFDAGTKRWLEDCTVLIRGDRIEAVGPTDAFKPPAGAEIIDARGKAILPGLWDMHVHLGPADGPLNIAAGVTTVRDMDNDPDLLADLVRRYDEGLAIGPHILKVGVVEGRGEKSLSTKFTAETVEEGRAALDHFVRHGYVQYKFYNSAKPDLIPVLAREAHDRGMRVSGHVPYGMIAEDAVRAGYDEIQHINQVMLEFFADRQTETRNLTRFTLVGEKAAALDLASRPVQDFLALLHQNRTVIDPTIVIFEQLYLGRPGEMDPTFRSIAHRLPPNVARFGLVGGLEAKGGRDPLYRASFRKVLAFLKVMHDAGLPIVPGTDGWSGFWLHRELELYVEAGIPAADVLQMATLGAARVMRLDARRGSIAPGMDADLVLVDGDPIARISDVRQVVTVVKSGTVYDSAAVYATVGVRPAGSRRE